MSKPCRLRRGAGYGACADDGVWGGSPTSIFAGPSALRKWQVWAHLPCLPVPGPARIHHCTELRSFLVSMYL